MITRIFIAVICPLLLAGIFACSSKSEKNDESLKKDTITSELPSNDTLEDIDPLENVEFGSDIIGLKKKFISRAILDTADIEMLRLNPLALTEVSWPDPQGYFETELGHAYIYYTHGSCAAVQCFGQIEIAYFDYDGYYMNTVWTPIIDRGSRSFKIQDNIICIYDDFDEYVLGEYVEEATGEVIEIYSYFAEINHQLKDVEDLNSDELAYLRNRVFAQHGYIFQSDYYSNVFSQYGWYQPQFKNVDHLLTEEEKRFVDFLLALEHE